MTYTIIMRSAPSCPFCEKAKALLDKRGLQYETIDLTGRHTALRVFKALGHTTIPANYRAERCDNWRVRGSERNARRPPRRV